ncbi:hypothetical protein [Endozoicomonas sp. GU-1]|nr:hypothetical protein [Endozoicomonas sp. GU-1]WBA84104.1 hypothetical protein O2T12_23630 [Endozoicomonas sp. GU-1]WBA88822.1 hypothetical protein O3276_12800 [Endozoicomonas sp. GU-1]
MIITLLRQEGFVTTEALVQHFNLTLPALSGEGS